MIGQGKGCKWRGKSSQYRAGKASLRGASRRAPAAGQTHEELMLGSHCFVMASRRALRGASRRAPAAGQTNEELMLGSHCFVMASGGAPGGRLQRARHTRNKARFALFCDGLPAGPPGAPAAGQTNEGIQSSWSAEKADRNPQRFKSQENEIPSSK